MLAEGRKCFADSSVFSNTGIGPLYAAQNPKGTFGKTKQTKPKTNKQTTKPKELHKNQLGLVEFVNYTCQWLQS